jgi:hypothetical protein
MALLVSCLTSPVIRADEAKRKQDAAVAAFKELLERSNLKPSSTWRKVAAKLQDEEAYEVAEVFVGHQLKWLCVQNCLMC